VCGPGGPGLARPHPNQHRADLSARHPHRRHPLTAQSIALIIKKRAQAAGLGPRDFAGHSLRSGYATRAARDGHHATQIADITRHNDQRVLNGYIQAGRDPSTVARVL